MNKIKILIISILLLPIIVSADECKNTNGSFKSGNISVSISNVSLNSGESKTFTVTASCAAGKITVTSSNPSVATVSSTSEFLDNSSANIMITAKGGGTANINIVLSDIADYTEKILTGTKTITVNVKGSPVTPSSSSTPSTTPSTNPSSSTTPEQSKEVQVEIPTGKEDTPISISKIQIEGYNIDFNQDVHEYTIKVENDVKTIKINAISESTVIGGIGEVDITGKDQVNITFKKGDETLVYVIHIARDQEKEETPEIIIPDTDKSNHTVIYAVMGLIFFVSIMVIVYALKK